MSDIKIKEELYSEKEFHSSNESDICKFLDYYLSKDGITNNKRYQD